jgi:hypothetical protein
MLSRYKRRPRGSKRQIKKIEENSIDAEALVFKDTEDGKLEGRPATGE